MRKKFTVFLSQKTARRLFNHTGCLWGIYFFFFFFGIFASISALDLSQYIHGVVTNLLNCASKCEDGKLLRKTKIIFFVFLYEI